MPPTRGPLALVHGWGMNARVFDGLADRLAERFDVRVHELPGHGGREALGTDTLRSWGDDLARVLPAGAVVLGWSLGGQVAVRAALDHPDRVSRLILLASTPKFVQGDAWAHGIAGDDLASFGAALLADPAATLLRFLTLQTRGMAGQKALLQTLRQTMFAAPAARADALEAGLAMLGETDLRAEIARVAQPALVIHGALDTLTPAGAGAWLAQSLADARLVELPRAAHAPHLSHLDEVAAAIGSFLDD